MSHLPGLQLTIVIGQYAQAYHMETRGGSVTNTVTAWRDHWPNLVPLPHPSPRNNIWIQRNPWFMTELIPVLQARVAEVLGRR